MHATRTPDVRLLRRALVAAGALAVSALTPAYGQAQNGPGTLGALTGNMLFSNDSDDFVEARTNLGYLFPNGWGLGASGSYYQSPGWSATGQGVYGMYRQYTAQQTIDARLGVMDTNGYTTPTGMLDYLRHINADASLGVSAERDVVDSTQGIMKGLTYDALILVGDYQFTQRFNVGVAAGATWFSDNNTRPVIRTRWNYELVPNSGFNAYIKTRNYYNTAPNQGDYYAPRRLGEYSAGLSWRTALGGYAVFFASADAGHQNTEDTSETIWSARIGLQNHRSRTVQWQVAVETTNNRASSVGGGGGTSYRYTSVTGRLMFPFN